MVFKWLTDILQALSAGLSQTMRFVEAIGPGSKYRPIPLLHRNTIKINYRRSQLVPGMRANTAEQVDAAIKAAKKPVNE